MRFFEGALLVVAGGAAAAAAFWLWKRRAGKKSAAPPNSAIKNCDQISPLGLPRSRRRSLASGNMDSAAHDGNEMQETDRTPSRRPPLFPPGNELADVHGELRDQPEEEHSECADQHSVGCGDRPLGESGDQSSVRQRDQPTYECRDAGGRHFVIQEELAPEVVGAAGPLPNPLWERNSHHPAANRLVVVAEIHSPPTELHPICETDETGRPLGSSAVPGAALHSPPSPVRDAGRLRGRAALRQLSTARQEWE